MLLYTHTAQVQVAIILSSVGAGLQSFAGAPMVLAAIATDFEKEIPILTHFAPAHRCEE
jgi:hypothetical protein